MMWWLLFVLVVLSSSVAAEEVEDLAKAQVEWLQAKGGYFNPKLSIQAFDPNDATSPKGVFASSAISKGEMLMIIPQIALLTADGASDEICTTTRNLMKELKLGDKSDFAPYIKYVSQFPRGQLPSAWSQEGKDLLHYILGDDLPPGDGVTDLSFEQDCGGSGDQFEEDTYLLTVSRSWDDKLVPLFDMVNHRRGKWANVDSNSAHRGRDIFIFAFRDIAKGEQIQYSYGECTDCEGFEFSYVGNHMLTHFGFLEPYPQRWLFHAGPDIVFDLDEDESGKMNVTWLKPTTPKKKQIRSLSTQLKRLQDMDGHVSKLAKELKVEHERNVILEFYQGMIKAMESAVEAAVTDEYIGRDEL